MLDPFPRIQQPRLVRDGSVSASGRQADLDPRVVQVQRELVRWRSDLMAVRTEVEAELVCSARAVLGTVDTVAALRPLLHEEGRYDGAVSRIVMAVLDEAGTVPEFKIPLLAAVGVRCCQRRHDGPPTT